jgi:hypothetical protein
VLLRVLRGTVVAEAGVASLRHLLGQLVKRPPGCGLGLVGAAGVGGGVEHDVPVSVAAGVTGEER